jgi:hypothetical protein
MRPILVWPSMTNVWRKLSIHLKSVRSQGPGVAIPSKQKRKEITLAALAEFWMVIRWI